jgi:hypothetical protein
MRPESYWDPILDRHAGPYILCGGFVEQTKKGPEGRSAWLKRRGRKIEWTNDSGDEVEHVKHDRDEVVSECYGYLREPGGPIDICVYSTSEQQFIGINVKREDAIGDHETVLLRQPGGDHPAAPAGAAGTVDLAADPRPGDAGHELHEGDAGAGGREGAPPAREGQGPRRGPDRRDRGSRAAGQAGGGGRGGHYRFVKDADEKLGTTPALVLATFKSLGRATVAEVAAAIESSLTTADAKALVASHATRLKAAGLLEKEAA